MTRGVNSGESQQEVNVKARGKRKRDAVGQPLPLLQEKTLDRKGRHAMTFQRRHGE